MNVGSLVTNDLFCCKFLQQNCTRQQLRSSLVKLTPLVKQTGCCIFTSFHFLYWIDPDSRKPLGCDRGAKPYRVRKFFRWEIRWGRRGWLPSRPRAGTSSQRLAGSGNWAPARPWRTSWPSSGDARRRSTFENCFAKKKFSLSSWNFENSTYMD